MNSMDPRGSRPVVLASVALISAMGLTYPTLGQQSNAAQSTTETGTLSLLFEDGFFTMTIVTTPPVG
jgi:hypothetical protein